MNTIYTSSEVKTAIAGMNQYAATPAAREWVAQSGALRLCPCGDELDANQRACRACQREADHVEHEARLAKEREEAELSGSQYQHLQWRKKTG